MFSKKPKIEEVGREIIGKLQDRAAVLASVNEAFDDFEKKKAKEPDAEIVGAAFIFITGSEKADNTAMHATIGGDKRVLLPMALQAIMKS